MGIHQVLERTPSFSSVEPEVLSALAQVSTTRRIGRGECIWDAGELPKYFVVVRSGVVKVVRSSAGGRSIICGLFGAPDSVGDLALLRGVAYPASAIAVSEAVELVLTPREALLAALATSKQLGGSLALHAQCKVQNLLQKIDVLSAGTVEARLAALLLSLYERFGDDFDDGSIEIPVSLSRQELADLVNTSAETAIRVMTRWERAETVFTHDHGFMIKDVTQLRLASGQC